MQLRKYRWSRDYESAEEELLSLLSAKGITAHRWELEAFEPLEPTVLQTDTRIWCAEGSISYMVDGKKFSLQPGDTLDVPAFMGIEATAGISGCSCYQSDAPQDAASPA